MNETRPLFLLKTLNCYDIGKKTFKLWCAAAICRNAATSEQAMAS